MSILITDYIKNPLIEKKILGQLLTDSNSYNSELIRVLLVWHQKIDKKYLDLFPNLKAIVRYGVGYDQIDLRECKKRRIAVCNTPDYGSDEVSDTALALIMNFSRRINQYNFCSKSYKDIWQEKIIKNIKRTKNLKVGIIGAGRIGSILIRKLNSIGFQTSFYDPYLNDGYEKILDANRHTSLKSLIKESDIISLNCNLNPETKHMVDDAFISHMKKGSALVNTARGGLIKDLDIIYKFIKSNHLLFVGLDVLPEEPPSESNLIECWRSNSKLSERIIINPHTAFYSIQSFVEMRKKASINALNILRKDIYKSRII